MENKILILDLETTGFSPSKSMIAEIGIVSLDVITGEKEILFDQVVKEPAFTPSDVKKSWIVQNRYMSAEEIIRAPFLSDFIAEIQNIINKYPVGATAYNNKFDFRFLDHRGIAFPKKLQCPMLLSTDICKIPKKNGRGWKWPTVTECRAYFFGKDTGYVEAHRGASDAMDEAEIVFELINLGLFEVGNE